MKVVIAGGGTAGHIEPALNFADAFRARHPEAEVVALGTRRGLETTLVPQRGYELVLVEPVPLPRRISLDLVKLPFRLAKSVTQARAAISDADVVVGFGGYVAMTAYLAARGRVPVVVHEANARPGIANRLGARWAAGVAETVEGTLPNARVTGLPIRPAIAQLQRSLLRAQARDFFGLSHEGPVLLVFGGSQGAQRINTAVAAALENMSGVSVLHAVGPRNELPAQRTANYIPLAYVDRMDLAYAAADLVVCRSGAMTVAEISAVGLPAVFVPFAIGNGEQALNAAPLVNSGAALLCPDTEFTAQYVLETVLPLLRDDERLLEMSARSSSAGRKDAAAELCDLVEGVMRK